MMQKLCTYGCEHATSSGFIKIDRGPIVGTGIEYKAATDQEKRSEMVDRRR